MKLLVILIPTVYNHISVSKNMLKASSNTIRTMCPTLFYSAEADFEQIFAGE